MFDTFIDRFTDAARDAVSDAEELARRNGHGQVLPEHLLVALAQQDAGVAAEALRGFEPSPEILGERLLAALGEGRSPSTFAPPRAPATERVLQLVLREALGLGHNYIGTEHLLLTLLRPDSQMPKWDALLPSVKRAELRQRVTDLLDSQSPLNPRGARLGTSSTKGLAPMSRAERSGDSRFDVGPGCHAELNDGRRVDVIGVNALEAIATDDDGSRVLYPWPQVLSVTQPAQ